MANIIPKPLKVVEREEKVYFSEKTVICGDFTDTIKLFSHLIPKAVEAKENKLIVTYDSIIAKDGYKIECYEGDIKIYCSDRGGALYGFMTLIQLCAGKDNFNAVAISDKPKFAWRSFMLDCSRHFWSVEYIKHTLDIMASLKLNVFHWHLCDDQGWRIEIKKYPVLTQKGTARRGSSRCPIQTIDKEKPFDEAPYGEGLYYTQQQAREIVEYAAARNITVVPEIDVPGHASAIIACMPQLSCTGEEIEVASAYGVLDKVLCCAKPQVYEVLKDIFDEICDLFPAPYFHIGGDEVVPDAWNKCPDCQDLMKKNGYKSHVELHGHFNNILIEYLKTKGKRTIGWNDMLNPNLDKTAIGQFWTFERGLEAALDWVNNQGGQAIISSQVYLYADYPYSRLSLPATYNFNASFLGIEHDEAVLGYEMPLWTEYIADEEKFAFHTDVRLLALSESCWTDPRLKNYEDFEHRVEKMRTYFEEKGMVIPPRSIYNGYTFDEADNITYFERRYKAYCEHWMYDVDCEYNLFKQKRLTK